MEAITKPFLNYFHKSATLSFSIVIAYYIIITAFPFVGFLFNTSVPMKRIIAENLASILPLFIISIPLSILLALLLPRITKRRILKLIITGVLSYFFATFISLLFLTDFIMSPSDFPTMFMMTFLSMFAFSAIAIPLIVFAMLILEKWTREKTPLGKS